MISFTILKLCFYDTYEEVGSCNADSTLYLVPDGTANQISYTSKPEKSFRVSDHWNWFANLKKCPYEKYIQCLSVDLPFAKKRPANGMASKPINAVQVSVIGKDGKYHAVYGEVFNRKTKTWGWIESNPLDVIASLEV